MARTPEGKVKDAITKILREFGVSYFFPNTGGYGRSGVSDIVCCYRGRFIAIEVKSTPAKKPTALQQAYLNEVEDQRGIAMVINNSNVDLVRKTLEVLG